MWKLVSARDLGHIHMVGAKMALIPLLLMGVFYAFYWAIQLLLLGQSDAASQALFGFLRSVPGASLFTAVVAVTSFWQASRLTQVRWKAGLAGVASASSLAVWFHFALHLIGHAETAEDAIWTLPTITLGAALAGWWFTNRGFGESSPARQAPRSA